MAKKTDAVEYPQIFHRVGILTNEDLGRAGLLFTSLPMQ
jgi:hypothetical protein